MADTDDTGAADLGKAEPVKDEPVLAEAPAPVQAVTPQKSRSVLWPILGGVVAAAAGFGLAQVVPNGWPVQDTTSLSSQLAAEVNEVKTLKAQIVELGQRIETVSALADRVSKLETAPPAAQGGDQVAALEARIATLEARPSGTTGDPAALTQLRAEVEALKANGAGIVSPEVQAALDAKVKDTEAKLAAIEAAAQSNAEAVTARAALSQIAAALDSGAPYTAALADLKGATLPAVLTDNASAGLPTLQGLQADFPAAARAALEAALRAHMGQTWSERVATFLRAQTGARALAPREGDDPDAVLSRAEAATAKGDLATALKELSALPPEGQAAMADWQARAQLRLDAAAALQSLNKAG